jgi:hypothetical protein
MRQKQQSGAKPPKTAASLSTLLQWLKGTSTALSGLDIDGP